MNEDLPRAGISRSLLLADTTLEGYLGVLQDVSWAKVVITREPSRCIVDLREPESRHLILGHRGDDVDPMATVPERDAVRVVTSQEQDGVHAAVSCAEPGDYGRYLDVISASKDAGARDPSLLAAARRMGDAANDPGSLRVILATDSAAFTTWLREALGREVGWIETGHIGYYCLQVEYRLPEEGEPDLLRVVCGCVGFGSWGHPDSRYRETSAVLITLRLEEVSPGQLSCQATWHGDGGLAAFLQVLASSVGRFAAGDQHGDLLKEYEILIRRWQQEEPVRTLTLLPEDAAATYDGRFGPLHHAYWLDTDLWGYRDWLVEECGLVRTIERDADSLWLWDDDEIFAYGLGISETSDEAWSLDGFSLDTDGSSLEARWNAEGEWASAEMHLRKTVYWAELRAEEGENGLQVTATALLPTGERLVLLRKLRRAGIDRFGEPLTGADRSAGRAARQETDVPLAPAGETRGKVQSVSDSVWIDALVYAPILRKEPLLSNSEVAGRANRSGPKRDKPYDADRVRYVRNKMRDAHGDHWWQNAESLRLSE